MALTGAQVVILYFLYYNIILQIAYGTLFVRTESRLNSWSNGVSRGPADPALAGPLLFVCEAII